MEPLYASNEEFDGWAIPPPTSDPPYAVDDAGLTYGAGPWPFRRFDDGHLATVRIAPSSEYRAWRNEYVLVHPNEDGSGAEAQLQLWLRPQGMGGYVLRVNVTLDLARDAYSFAPLHHASLQARAESKAQRILDLVGVARRERDRGATRPTTAAETAKRVEAVASVEADSFAYTRRDLDAHWFQTAIDEARLVWERRIEQYVTQRGDQGTCVLGAGIAVAVGKRRAPVVVLEPPTRVQGASVWEESVDDIVAFLRTKGILARYHAGRMD